MEITKEMFMNLSNEQRLKMYEHVAMYLDSHYESVIDAGLTDDIFLAEYSRTCKYI